MLWVEVIDCIVELVVIGELIGCEGVEGELVVWCDFWFVVVDGSVLYVVVEEVDYLVFGC